MTGLSASGRAAYRGGRVRAVGGGTMIDRFGHWPEGQAYRTPKPDPVMLPICRACGSRHKGPTPNCTLANEPEDDNDDAD